MSFANSSPNARLADKAWRSKNSRWRWWVFLGVGMLGCVGFLIIAIRVQSKKFWTAAAVASAGSALCWIAMALSGGTSESAGADKAAGTTDGGGWGAGVTLAVWVAQIVYALLISRDYLRWKADSNNEWYHQPVGGQSVPNAAAPTPVQSAASQAAPFLGVDTSEYFADAPAPQAPTPQPAPPPPPPASNSASAPPPTYGPIDINSASPSEIAMGLDVGDALVRRVVDARIERGRFTNIEDLVAKAGLQPHEMLKFRDKVRFGSGSTGSAGGSPSPAAQPNVPTEPGAGRILDY